jgi:uncharacterized protein YndB with AHSA1/START domain
MKWVVRILIALAAIVAVITMIGAVLPRVHVESRTAAFRAAPDSLWATLSDLEHYPGWAPAVTTATRLPDRNGHPVWEHSGPEGKMPLAVTAFEPPHRLVLEIVATDLPYSGNWTWEVTPSGSGALVTVTERGVVDNPIFRFLSRFVFGQTATMDGYLKALGRRHGETVTPASGS